MAVITMIEAPKVGDEPSWGSHQGAGRIASPEEWAAKQFSGVDLGDRRLTVPMGLLPSGS